MSEALKIQYHVLSELKRIDDKAARLKSGIDQIPQDIAKLDAQIAARREEFSAAKTQCDATEKRLRTAEGELRDREDKLKKAEGKMMEVKTNEEYQAAIRENETQKKAMGGLEDQVLALITEAEEQRDQLKEVEKTVKTYEATVTEEKKSLLAEKAKLEALYQEQVTKRTEITGQLAPDTASLYAQLAGRFGGDPVAIVQNGMCQSCNISVRPQLYNEVLQFKALHRCSNCGKILILPPQDAARDASLGT